jgi:hypothetical protein
MHRFLRLMFNRGGDEFAETAIAMPVIVLVSIALMNLTMAGFASVNANNAANYAARIGSVTQQGAGGAAYGAAMESVSHAQIGDYAVSVSGGGFPGARINVLVDWTVPNYIGGLMSFLGVSLSDDFHGAATSVFRQEGW